MREGEELSYLLTPVWAAAFEVERVGTGGGLLLGKEVACGCTDAGSDVGELAHLLLGVHHWHPLEDTKGSVSHSHPALLPVRGWEDWVRGA